MFTIHALYYHTMHGLADVSQVASRGQAESDQASTMGPVSNRLERRTAKEPLRT